MKCLLLAYVEDETVPLVTVHGLTLAERALYSARTAGVTEVVAVLAPGAGRLVRHLEDVARRLKLPLLLIEHHPERPWPQQALLHFDEPFLVMEADRLFDPQLLERLVGQMPPPDGMLLAVDGDRENALVELDRVVRVRRRGERVEALGQRLEWYDSFYTGLGLAAPGVLAGLDPATPLEEALNALVRAGRLAALDVTGAFWCELHHERRLKPCRWAYLRHVRTDLDDGLISRWFNRLFSIQLSRLLAPLAVRPGQMTLVAFLLSLGAGWLLAQGRYPELVAGGLLAQLAAMVGGSDSELARLKFLDREYSGWVARLLDQYADAALLLGATWHLLGIGFDPRIATTAGFVALAGTAGLYLTAGRYRRCLQARNGTGALAWWLGRDLRVFLLLAGALANHLLPAVVTLAVLAHFEVVRRFLLCRSSRGDEQSADAEPSTPGRQPAPADSRSGFG